jgi:hypothetical protein
VTDEDAIGNIESGRQQLSPGYECKLFLQEGTYKGEKFDAIQIDRRYNHVAICDKARGGSDLKLNLDSIEGFGFEYKEDADLTTEERNALPDSAFCFVIGEGENKIRKFPAYDAKHVRSGLSYLSKSNLTPAQKEKVRACLIKKANKFGVEVSEDSFEDFSPDSLYNLSNDELNLIKQKKELTMPKYKINGIEYEAAQEVVNHITSLDEYISKLKSEAVASKDSLTATQAKLDEAKAKIDTLSKREIDKEIRDGVKNRILLLKVAQNVLDDKDNIKMDELSDLELKKAIIVKHSPNAKLDGKDDVYINARFDAIVENLEFDPTAAAKNTAKAKERYDGNNVDKIEKARQDSEDRIKKAYMNIPKQFSNDLVN